MTATRILAAIVLLSLSAPSFAQLPPPPDDKAMADWCFPWADNVPGEMSAADLLDKPAGKNGPIVARDGHFFTGDKRIRFVGVNIAFGGNFPTHEQADAVAKRFANFGINIVRFHHMDNQPYPGGIFADRGLEKLSDEALERLDYFIAALKKEGVYADLNLHVSRPWSRTKKWPDAAKLEGYDKQLDIFHPDLIAANKQYAKDLLSHVNKYTNARYADEPAVAMVEINNEDTIFLWGGEQKLAELPETYAAILQKQWNAWLVKEYGTREKLKEAWAKGAEPLGAELIEDPKAAPDKWVAEKHGAAKMDVFAEVGPVDVAAETSLIVIKEVDGTSWHLQFSRPGIELKKGKFYTLTIKAKFLDGSKGKTFPLGLSVSMAHAPWGNLGLQRTISLADLDTFSLGFIAADDDKNARVTFQLGAATGSIALTHVSLREGGREGLRDEEDPAVGTVSRGGLGNAETPARTADWYRFLQATDEAYFTGMYDFLKKEVGVKCPVTGTIGLGMLGSLNQSKMDFVDAHAYWDHPHFPRKQWDMRDWEIKNKPMVDDPAGATFWGLAATRFWHKPFTVTEYNHAAPNEWQAECVPMIFAYAALQDWDAVFLFDYTGDTHYEKQITSNFFSIEGNASKMGAMPLAARLFLSGTVKPSEGQIVVQPTPSELYDNASHYFYNQWPFERDIMRVTWQQALGKQLAIWDVWKPLGPDQHAPDARVQWTSNGPGTGSGRFVLKDPNAAVFVGFAKGETPIDVGLVKITKLESPFAAIQVVSSEIGKPLNSAARVLIAAIARQSAEGMQWNAARTSISDHWGKPPAKIELVHADIELASDRDAEVWAIGLDGKRLKQVPAKFANGKLAFSIGGEPTIWYEVVRK